MGMTGEDEVESRADEERSSTHTEDAKEGEREQCANEDRGGERRSQPPEEAARADVDESAKDDHNHGKRP
jgi:hypothetical protein